MGMISLEISEKLGSKQRTATQQRRSGMKSYLGH